MKLTGNIPNGVSEEKYISEISKIPKEIITTNGKLKKDHIGLLSIPALYGTILENGSLKDFTTCPGAGVCARFCYAQKGFYSMKLVKLSQNRKLQFILDSMHDPKKLEIFSAMVYSDILRNGYNTIRIHDSGDYFSVPYFNFLSKYLINKFPNIQFYSYTKNIPMFLSLMKRNRIPENLKLIFSEGSKFDSMIPEDMAHSRIFKDRESLVRAGYIDCSESDLIASVPEHKKIGLIFH